MKLLKLSLENINSLRGKTVIDFEKPEYTSNVFAITGPTGAGKTTILDAICLALYGQTPRIKKISKSSGNEVMTRNEDYCSAEVLFELGDKRYLASWSQHKARTGNLQDKKHEISDQTDEGKVIAEGSKAVEKIKTLVGLDFDQFCKTVQIAQGEFDKFLKTKPEDRPKAFNEIVGEGKYKKIAEKVFRKRADCKLELDNSEKRENDLEILSDSDRESLEQRISELLREREAKEQQIREIKEKEDWIKEVDRLTAVRDQAKQKFDEHRENVSAFVPKEQKLQRAEKAYELGGAWGNLCSKETLLNDLKKEQEEIQQKILDLDEGVQEAGKALQNAENDLIKAQNNELAIRPKIASARKLDGEIATRQQTVQRADLTVREKKKALSDLEKKLEDINGELARANKTLQEAKDYQIAHAADARLGGVYESIVSGLRDLDDLKKDFEKADEKLQNAQGELADAKKEFSTACDDLEECKKKQTEAQASLDEKENARQNLLDGRTIDDLDEEMDCLNRKVAEAKAIANFEEQRKQLVDGKPCPLCGAVHHPYAQGNLPKIDQEEETLKNLKEIINKNRQYDKDIHMAQTAKGRADSDRILAEANCKAAETKVQVCEKNCTEKAKVRDDVKNRLGKKDETLRHTLTGLMWGTLETLDSQVILADLEKWIGSWTANEKKLNDAQAKCDEINRKKIETDIKRRGAAEELSDAETVCSQDRKELDAKIDERKKLLGDLNPDIEEERHQKILRETQNVLGKAKERVTQTLRDRDNAQEREEELRNKKNRAEEEKIGADLVFQKGLEEKGFKDREDYREARLDDKELKLLRQEKKNLDQEESRLKGELNVHEKSLNTKREEKKTEKTLDELQSERDEAVAKKKEIEKISDSVKEKLSRDKQNRETKESLGKEREKVQKELDKWDALWEVLGPAQDSFSKYAQSLIFQQVIRHANDCLKDFQSRYLLTRHLESKDGDAKSSDDALKFKLDVIDLYQGGEERCVENLSGGEGFIVSLALALGISRFIEKKVHINSLFLDEGFGTLDEDYLTKVIDTLQRICDQGKTVGIITHVAALQGDDSPIATKIKVETLGNGHSRVSGPGVTFTGQVGERPRGRKKK